MDFIIDTIFRVGNPWGQGIVYLIITLFAIGFLRLLYNGRHIYRQNGFLKSVSKRFESLKSKFEEISTESKGGEISKAQRERKKEVEQKLQHIKEEMLEDIPRHSIIARRIEDLFKVRYVGELTYESLRDHLFTEEMEKTGFSRYLASILILLGLIGTVLGLSQSVINLQPLLSELKDVADLAQVSKAIAQTLSGMKTAFSATIAGIATTILLTFFNFLFGKYATSFLNKLESFTTLYLIPYFLVPTTEEASIRFADTVSKGAEALDRSANPLLEVSKNLDGSVNKVNDLMKSLTEIGSKYDQAIDKLATTQKGLINAQQKVEDRFKETLIQSENAIKKFQEETSKLVGGANEAIKQAALSIMDDTKDTVKDFISEYISVIQTIAKDTKGIMENIDKAYLKKVEDMTGAIKESIKQALAMNRDEVQKSLNAQFNAQSKVISKHEEVIDKYSQVINGTAKIYDLVSLATNENHHEEMAKREDRLIKSIEGLANNLKDLTGEVYTKLDAAEGTDERGKVKASGSNTPRIQ